MCPYLSALAARVQGLYAIDKRLIFNMTQIRVFLMATGLSVLRSGSVGLHAGGLLVGLVCSVGQKVREVADLKCTLVGCAQRYLRRRRPCGPLPNELHTNTMHHPAVGLRSRRTALGC